MMSARTSSHMYRLLLQNFFAFTLSLYRPSLAVTKHGLASARISMTPHPWFAGTTSRVVSRQGIDRLTSRRVKSAAQSPRDFHPAFVAQIFSGAHVDSASLAMTMQSSPTVSSSLEPQRVRLRVVVGESCRPVEDSIPSEF